MTLENIAEKDEIRRVRGPSAMANFEHCTSSATWAGMAPLPIAMALGALLVLG